MSVENETDGPELLLPPEPHPQLSEDGIDSYYKEVRHCSVWSNETQEYILYNMTAIDVVCWIRSLFLPFQDNGPVDVAVETEAVKPRKKRTTR